MHSEAISTVKKNILDEENSYKNILSKGASSKLQNLGVLQHQQASTCLRPFNSVTIIIIILHVHDLSLTCRYGVENKKINVRMIVNFS